MLDKFSQKKECPDPESIRAICNLSYPKDKKSLQSFLGMVNYLRMYTPNLSLNCKNLNSLLKKENKFEWNSIHKDEFSKIKKLIENAATLEHFDKDV